METGENPCGTAYMHIASEACGPAGVQANPLYYKA